MITNGDKYHEFRRITISVFLSAIFIFLGAYIYIALRPNEAVFFSWVKIIGLNDWLSGIRNFTLFKSVVFPEWIIYSLPNGFWAFSYTVIIISIWWNSKSFAKYFWFASIPILILGYEILQINQYLHGIFCLQDISAVIAGIFLGTLIGIKLTKNYSHEKSNLKDNN